MIKFFRYITNKFINKLIKIEYKSKILTLNKGELEILIIVRKSAIMYKYFIKRENYLLHDSLCYFMLLYVT